MSPVYLRSQPLRADFTHPSPTIVSAYAICRAAEHVVDPIQYHWPPDDRTVKAKLINIRILGHLLSQTRFLSDTALVSVATGIFSSLKDSKKSNEADVEALNKLGEFYRNYLLRPFRKFRARTPNVSSHPSPPSYKLTKEEVDQMLAETPRCYSKSRQLAMQREDFRCIVTRILDKPYARRLPGTHEPVETLELCHIFAESTSYDVEDTAENRDYSCNVWSVLKSFGYTNIVNDLATAKKIHSLQNVMMMIHLLHDHFDTLDLWFEPIEDVPNRYRMRSVWMLPHGLADGQEVTFQSADSRLPLPDPEYLRIHAACCRVAHLSAASGLFDELERDLALDPDPTVQASEFARTLHTHLSLEAYSVFCDYINWGPSQPSPTIHPWTRGRYGTDPIVTKLLVVSLMSLGTIPLVKGWLPSFIASTASRDLVELAGLCMLWLVGCVVSTSIWPNLAFCYQFEACHVLTTMMVFAWLGWTVLVGLIVIAILAVVSKVRPTRAPMMV